MKRFYDPFASGILTGLFLQLAIGPVFFYLLSITLESTYTNGLYAVLGVTIADYLYIALSIAGIGKLLEKKRLQRAFGLISSGVLILFGLIILYSGVTTVIETDMASGLTWTPQNSFSTSFFLTISSPLTIVFWSGIFSGKAIEKGYNKQQLVLFGAGAGFATLLFLSSAILLIAQAKTHIPQGLVQTLNCIVGALLLFYGVTRFFNALKNRNDTVTSNALCKHQSDQ